VKRAVTRKIELHAERVKALKSYLDGGKKDASFTPPPTALTAIQESLQENLDPGKIANLSYVSVPSLLDLFLWTCYSRAFHRLNEMLRKSSTRVFGISPRLLTARSPPRPTTSI
jgi:hypothetical protein